MNMFSLLHNFSLIKKIQQTKMQNLLYDLILQTSYYMSTFFPQKKKKGSKRGVVKVILLLQNWPKAKFKWICSICKTYHAVLIKIY